MHIGSVLSGFDAGNVNTDAQIVDYWVWGCVRLEGSKKDDFSIFGVLGGDFYEETHEANLFGVHNESVLSGLEAGNVNNG